MIGSVLPGCNNVASSVIMAYWAGSGSDLHAIDYSLMRVGGVQDSSSTRLCSWKKTSLMRLSTSLLILSGRKYMENPRFFGVSDIVRVDLFELPDVLFFACPKNRLSCC